MQGAHQASQNRIPVELNKTSELSHNSSFSHHKFQMVSNYYSHEDSI